jgi:hypothetical protein
VSYHYDRHGEQVSNEADDDDGWPVQVPEVASKAHRTSRPLARSEDEIRAHCEELRVILRAARDRRKRAGA